MLHGTVLLASNGTILLASNGNSKFCCLVGILAILEQYRLLNRSYD